MFLFKKKVKPCEYVYESIRFDMNAICSCCANRRGIYIPVKNNSDINKIMKLYFEKVNKIAAGIYTKSECKGCYKLEDEYIKSYPYQYSSHKINKIYICNWRYCNIDCVYCVYKYETHNINGYSALPYIKWLKENDKLAKDVEVAFGGGEPAILKDIDEMLDFFSESYISIMSNMVIFRKSYISLLKEGRLQITSSIDCGNKNLYKLIHNVDGFDKVVNNLQQVINYSKNNNQLILKYIILHNINDRNEYVDEFVQLAKKIDVSYISFSFNYNYDNIGKTIPENILNVYIYAQKTAIENGFELIKDPRVEVMFEAKKYI